jgi:heme A synthase
VLPSGAYVVKGDQVRWVPAVDVTIAVLASLSLVRMLARTWTRQRRHRRRP